VIDAIWGAKTFRPDGIVDGRELWSEITADQHVECIPYPYDGLNEVTLGQRRGELVTWTAGSGVGKSAITREIEYHLLMSGETVGVLRLEESKKRSATGLMGLYLQRPIHLDLTPWSQLPEDEQAARRAAYEATAGSGRWFCYDHFGSTDIDNLLSRVRYLVHGCGCNWIILDHLSIVVSGLEDGDERKTIDVVMTKLRSFVEETGCGMHLVSHLRRPEGNRGHEQGAVTSLSQLRGSHSIAQLSDMVIGAERDQQGDDADLTTLRVLKNRFSGRTGVAAHLRYDHDTGRLAETSPDFHDETSSAPDEDDF
jgi:twinkle protein